MRTAHARALTLALVSLVAVFQAGIIARAQAAKLDINGAWVFEVTIDGAVTGTPTVTFKTEGEKVTGHYSSMTLGENDFTGTLKGSALDFTFNVADIGGVIYKATVDSSGSMKGTISIADGAAAGTFTGKRK
jgi:plastocyanin